MKPTLSGGIYPARRARPATVQTGFAIIKGLPRFAAALASIFIALAACAAMSPTTAELERLRIQIEANPTEEAEVRYLALFPKTFNEFTKIFMTLRSPDELEKTSWEHLKLLEKLAVNHPRAVRDIWFGVAANAEYDADAVSQLQGQLAAYAAQDTQSFATQLMSRPEAERRNIITFLADKENFDAYKDYATLLSNLEKLGQPELRRLFLDAKTKRMKYRHEPDE